MSSTEQHESCPLSSTRAYDTARSLQRMAVEDEGITNLDKRPELAKQTRSSKLATFNEESVLNESMIQSGHGRKASLLTQALLTSPTLEPGVDNDYQDLPRLDTLRDRSTLPLTGRQDLLRKERLSRHDADGAATSSRQPSECHSTDQRSKEMSAQEVPRTSVEESLGRRRCISFACGRNPSLKSSANVGENPPGRFLGLATIPKDPERRPCLLKLHWSTTSSRKQAQPNDQPSRATHGATPEKAGFAMRHKGVGKDSSAVEPGNTNPDQIQAAHTASGRPVPSHGLASRPSSVKENKHKKCNRVLDDDDEWTREQIDSNHIMTINDTLAKENAIRMLGEEAEDEAEEDERHTQQDTCELDDDSDDETALSPLTSRHQLDESSDGGNESDDEGGFEDSDDDSDFGFTNGLWTPGLTTAATSTDQLEHVRMHPEGKSCGSSDECVDDSRADHTHESVCRRRARLSPSTVAGKQPRGIKQRSDVDDFIIGTLDEDRAQHEAYLSTFEERKRSRQKVIPQDIDPSFPTSDPDDDNNSDSSEEAAEEQAHDDNSDTGHSDVAVSADSRSGFPSPASRNALNLQRPTQPIFSRTSTEKSWKSISPTKRAPTPPPRRLFGQHGLRLRSPPPPSKRLSSPPPSRRPSPISATSPSAPVFFAAPKLAQNPYLISTASLPRSANPFWNQHQAQCVEDLSPSPLDALGLRPRRSTTEHHARGPVDIVLGLEHKRQRRREKYWRVQCQKAHAGKEKERKCHRGKGVERMREVGMVMQDRVRGYGQLKPHLMMLSI